MKFGILFRSDWFYLHIIKPMPRNFPKNIKCILFDLGGVVINIDWQLSVHAFAKILNSNFQTINKIMREHELVQRIEKGEMQATDFRNWFRDFSGNEFNDQVIDNAWNAMLLDIPSTRIEIIKRLSENYKVMCLSNTNAIHIEAFNKILNAASGYRNLEEVMFKTYYSHIMKMRKPDPRCWESILSENDLEADEVLYFDDNENNHQVAQQLGLHSVLIDNTLSIEKYFHE